MSEAESRPPFKPPNMVKQAKEQFPWVSENTLDAHLTMIRASSIYELVLSKHYAELGLSTSRFNLLWLLFTAQGQRISVGDLSRYIGITVPSVMKMIQILKAAHWLNMVKGMTDRRVTFVELTEQGLERMSDLLTDAYRFWEDMWSVLSLAEVQSLAVVLAKLREGLLNKYIGEAGWMAFVSERNRLAQQID